jgi:hypothetical protein
MFDTVPIVRYKVDVVIPEPLNDLNRRFLDVVQRSANRLAGFRGDDKSITLTLVEVSGMCREDALRGASSEVARIFPACNDKRYGEPRQKK